MQFEPNPAPTPAVAWYHQKWFVVLTMILFFPVGLALLWTSPVTRKSGRIAWSIVAGLILIGWLNGGESDKATPPDPGQVASAPSPSQGDSNPGPANQETSKPDPTPNPEPEPQPEPQPVKAELTEDAAKKLAGMKDITKVELVGGLGPDYTGQAVHVYYPLGTIWDEDRGVQKAAENAVRVFEKLFSHPDVYEVVVYAQGKFLDQYGKESIHDAIRIAWTRETAEKVEWKNFKDMAIVEPERVYNLARNYHFHAGFFKAVKDKRGLKVSGGSNS